MQKLVTYFFSKNISIHPIFNARSSNDMLTNDIVSFKQLDPDIYSLVSLNLDCVYSQQNCCMYPDRAYVSTIYTEPHHAKMYLLTTANDK